MTTQNSGNAQATAGADPLFVKVKVMRHMLGDIGQTRAYALINTREVKSVKSGKSRLVDVQSIHEYARRLLQAAGHEIAADKAA